MFNERLLGLALGTPNEPDTVCSQVHRVRDHQENHCLEIPQEGLIGMWASKGTGVGWGSGDFPEGGTWEPGFSKWRGQELDSTFKK